MLFGARSVSAIGDGMATVALAFAVLGFGGPSELGIVLLARELTIVAFLLPAGVLADRLPRRWLSATSDFVRAAAQAASAALVLTGGATVWRLVLLQALFGTASACFRPTETGLMPEAVSPPRLQQANAFVELVRSASYIVGPALGGVLVVAIGAGWTLAAGGACYALGAALLTRLRIPRAARVVRASFAYDFRQGFRELLSRSWVYSMIGAFGLYQLVTYPPLIVLGPYVAKQSLGGASAWGAIVACGGAGYLVGGALALRTTTRRPLVGTCVTTALFTLQFVLLGVHAPLPAIAAAALVGGAGMSVGNVFWVTTLQRNVPRDALSRISAFDWFGSSALNPIGYAVVGPVAGALGVGTTLVAAGVAQLGLISLPLLSRSVRALEREPMLVEPDPAQV